MGASVGVARSDGHDAPDAVVAAADGALYEAKRAGRSTWRRAGPVGARPNGTEVDAVRWSTPTPPGPSL